MSRFEDHDRATADVGEIDVSSVEPKVVEKRPAYSAGVERIAVYQRVGLQVEGDQLWARRGPRRAGPCPAPTTARPARSAANSGLYQRVAVVGALMTCSQTLTPDSRDYATPVLG